MTDIGLTHVAFSVRSLEASVGFYERYARMVCVHRRERESVRVAWLTDHTRPFVIVLVEGPGRADTPLGPFGHLGVACESRAEVDRLCAAARTDGILRKEPTDSGPPVGYWAFVADPDGNTLELSYGQEVGLTVTEAAPR
jgi:lactoylglutathione lyase